MPPKHKNTSLSDLGLGVCVWVCVCVCLLLWVCAKRETVDYQVQQAKHCLPWERDKIRERKRVRQELGGETERWFRNMEVKNGSPGEMASELGEQMNEKMQGWEMTTGRENSSDKEVKWQARPAGCKVIQFSGIFLEAMTPGLTSQPVCCCCTTSETWTAAICQLEWCSLIAFIKSA